MECLFPISLFVCYMNKFPNSLPAFHKLTWLRACFAPTLTRQAESPSPLLPLSCFSCPSRYWWRNAPRKRTAHRPRWRSIPKSARSRRLRSRPVRGPGSSPGRLRSRSRYYYNSTDQQSRRKRRLRRSSLNTSGKGLRGIGDSGLEKEWQLETDRGVGFSTVVTSAARATSLVALSPSAGPRARGSRATASITMKCYPKEITATPALRSAGFQTGTRDTEETFFFICHRRSTSSPRPR